MKKGGKGARTQPDARSKAKGTGPVIHQDPAWKRLWAWLLEDPSKTKQEGPTEREKAIQEVAERDRLRREQLIRNAFRRRRNAVVVDGITLASDTPPLPRAPRAVPRIDTQQVRSSPTKTTKTTKTNKSTPLKATPAGEDKNPAAETGPAQDRLAWLRRLTFVVFIVSLWHRLLGEEHRKSAAGNTVMIPPAETDWRWHLHRFFRSNVRGVVYARSALLTFLVLSAAWVSLYSTTGFDYTEMVFQSGDPDDPRNEYRLPFFVVESGSMMHDNAPWGRLGTVDPGDIVIIEKYRDDMEIQTFYGDGDKHVAGAKGDVIMFLPVEFRQNQEIFPIIHRAIAYVQRDVITVPATDPRTGQTMQAQSPRFTVEEFGIINARAINIPELGLHNYQPSAGGYLTRGDNQRTNNWADQALGVTPFPVPEHRIIGVMKAEIPVIGLAKIALTGQDQRMLNMDASWCSFLAGFAACDTWVLFFIVTILFIGVPLLVTTVVFGRRMWERQLDRWALQQQVAGERTKGPGDDADAAPAPDLPTFDATDLLSGKVQVGPGAIRTDPRLWEERTRSRLRTEGE